MISRFLIFPFSSLTINGSSSSPSSLSFTSSSSSLAAASAASRASSSLTAFDKNLAFFPRDSCFAFPPPPTGVPRRLFFSLGATEVEDIRAPPARSRSATRSCLSVLLAGLVVARRRIHSGDLKGSGMLTKFS